MILFGYIQGVATRNTSKHFFLNNLAKIEMFEKFILCFIQVLGCPKSPVTDLAMFTFLSKEH